MDPSAGVSFGMNLVSLNEHIYLQYDLTFHTLKFKTTTTTYDPVTSLDLINDISCNQYMLNNIVMFKYEFTHGKCRPALMGGGFCGILFDGSYHRHLEAAFTSQGSGILYEVDLYDNPFKQVIYGITLGAGAVIRLYKKQHIFLDLKYYSGLGLFENLNTNIISLNLGIPLQIN